MTKASRQQGSLLIAAIVIMVLAGTLGLAVSKIEMGTSHIMVQSVKGSDAFDGSESGLKLVESLLLQANCDPSAVAGGVTVDPVTTLSLPIDQKTITARITDQTATTPNQYLIESVDITTNNQRTVERQLLCTPGNGEGSNLANGGNAPTSWSMNGSNSVNADGSFTFSQNGTSKSDNNLLSFPSYSGETIYLTFDYEITGSLTIEVRLKSNSNDFDEKRRASLEGNGSHTFDFGILDPENIKFVQIKLSGVSSGEELNLSVPCLDKNPPESCTSTPASLTLGNWREQT
ncbi:MAG: hypothetical protein HQL52_01845 [Magnetococcales bacterium]|nr:hypothetical protein [Magnetococcales bacterium]